jgi:hypothetical protein
MLMMLCLTVSTDISFSRLTAGIGQISPGRLVAGPAKGRHIVPCPCSASASGWKDHPWFLKKNKCSGVDEDNRGRYPPAKYNKLSNQ